MANFDYISNSYDEWYNTSLGNFVDRVQTKMVFDLFKPTPGMKVLDSGCGTGVFSVKLAKAGCVVTGIDYSSKMIYKAKENSRNNNLDITFKEMNTCKLDFNTETFDGVISIAVFEFIKGYKKAFEECMRVLKPGGKLLIGTINKNSEWGQFYIKKAKKETSIFRFASFKTKEELITLDPERLTKYRECLFVSPDSSLEKINWEEENKLSNTKNGGFILALWEK